MTLFFHFLKRDSRSSGTWTFRTIMAALGFGLMGVVLIEGSGFGSQHQHVNSLIVMLAFIFGVTASLATGDAFRGNAWRETLEWVHLTRMSIGELFLIKLVTRFVSIFLGFLPFLVLFFLLLEIHDVSALLGIRCFYFSCCAVLFGISVGMVTSCHSNQATFLGDTAGRNTLMIWVGCWGSFYMFDLSVTNFLNGFSFFEGVLLFAFIISFGIAVLSSGIFRSVFDSRLGKEDRIKLVVLLTIPLFVYLLPLFSGSASAPRYYVFPAVIASYMVAIAFVYVHLASQMVKDADYLLKSSRWRFLIPPLEIIRQARVRRQANLRKKFRLNLPSSPVKPIPTTDPTPSRPGIWAGLVLSKDGAEYVSPSIIQSKIASALLIGVGVSLAQSAVLTALLFPSYHLSYVLFVAGVELCVFLGIMVRASNVLSGERRSGILELLLVSPRSSRVITEGVLHAFAGIRKTQSLLLIICALLFLIIAHIPLFLGRGSYDWGLFLYVPISLALCRFHRFRFLWIISCRDGLRYHRSIAASLTLRFLTVNVVPYGIFLSCFIMIANEPVRLSLCFLFPVLHWLILDRLAARSRNDLHDMARVIRA